MKGIFGDLFDLNGDGEMSFTESALEFAVLSDLMKEDDDDYEEDDDNDSDWDD